ncbi:hypothetical protein [Candidatus Tisiphia endosymbiont of Myopa tessellatipennis]|uniref:hypothetical protein n=1 Tax=Candidatus Tisiphia endosymbiont of Myopa tessellatipennis TaxID=3066257 RepID=UPI00313BA3A8
MAKSQDYSKSYLDSKKTILCTSNNLYDYASEQFDKAESVKEQLGLVPQVIGIYKIVYRYWNESLLFGKAEAAAGLAYLYREGLGVEKSEYKDKLYVSIGAKLGDPSCKELLPQRDHKDVASEAAKWLKAIQVITTRYPNKDAEISAADTVWANGQLEFHCQQSHSYQGASSSHLNDSYDTCPDTSFESEEDVTLGGSTKLHVCCEIM